MRSAFGCTVLLLLAFAPPASADLATVNDSWHWQDGKTTITYKIDAATLGVDLAAAAQRAVDKINASGKGWTLVATTGDAKINIVGASLGSSPPARTDWQNRSGATVNSRTIRVNTGEMHETASNPPTFHFGTATTQLNPLRVIMHELQHCCRLGHPGPGKAGLTVSIMDPIFPSSNPGAGHQNTELNGTDISLARQTATLASAPVEHKQFHFASNTEGWGCSAPLQWDPVGLDGDGGGLRVVANGFSNFILQSPTHQQTNVNPTGNLRNPVLEIELVSLSLCSCQPIVVTTLGSYTQPPLTIQPNVPTYVFFDLDEASAWQGLDLNDVNGYQFVFNTGGPPFTGNVVVDRVQVIESSLNAAPSVGALALLALSGLLVLGGLAAIRKRLNWAQPQAA
jgi:hypothetical protein